MQGLGDWTVSGDWVNRSSLSPLNHRERKLPLSPESPLCLSPSLVSATPLFASVSLTIVSQLSLSLSLSLSPLCQQHLSLPLCPSLLSHKGERGRGLLIWMDDVKADYTPDRNIERVQTESRMAETRMSHEDMKQEIKHEIQLPRESVKAQHC